MIVAAQIRAGRALLGWTQGELAKRAQVAPRTLALYEQDKRLPYDRTLDRITAALEDGGVRFVDLEEGRGAVLIPSPYAGD